LEYSPGYAVNWFEANFWTIIEPQTLKHSSSIAVFKFSMEKDGDRLNEIAHEWTWLRIPRLSEAHNNSIIDIDDPDNWGLKTKNASS